MWAARVAARMPCMLDRQSIFSEIDPQSRLDISPDIDL